MSPDRAGKEGAAEAGRLLRWRDLLDMVFAHRSRLVHAHLLAIGAALAAVPLPLLMPLVVDEVLLHKPGAMVAWVNRLTPSSWHQPVLYIVAVLVLTVVLRLASVGLGVLQSRSFSLISKDVVFRLRERLLGRVGRIALSEYETLGSGAVTSHFVTDLNAIDEFLGGTISKFLVAVLSLVGAAAILLWMHWQLALFILFLNPVVIYFTVILGKRVKDLKRRENRAFELFQQALAETLDAIHQIRAMNRERHYLARVVDRARDIRSTAAAYAWRSDAAGRLSFMVFLVGFDAFRALSMVMVVYSNLSIGEMMAVFGYLWFMMSPVQEIINIQYALFAAKAALGRLNGLLALEEEPNYSSGCNPFGGCRSVSVSLKDVCFSYRDGPPVLDHVSLEVAAGEKVALVGASGGGKSTLVHVLLGLYLPQQGSVSYNGVPIPEIGLDTVRERVATVLQSPALFNDTVRANLCMGREHGDEALWHALSIAQLDDTVRGMPIGLDTIVGRQGVRLSGGQRQRLAIARMVLADPAVVILDEATSALDAATEARLHEALHEFLAGRTTLIVAHRLSAVRQADRAYVFEAGGIVEEGSHHELLAQGGLYAQLYGRLQSGH